MRLFNASGFHEVTSASGLATYFSSSNERLPLSIEEALSPVRWRERFTSFACVATDRDSGEAVLVRDHLGLTPLYFFHEPHKKLIFGDSLPDILAKLPATPALLESEVRNLFHEGAEYTDATLYRGIYRVEPGHLIHIRYDGTLEKKAYWRLEREGEPLHYTDDRDYLAHFTALLKEAVTVATAGQENLAAEYSAGLDSSAVYCAARSLGHRPKLYMLPATPGTSSAETYDDKHEKAFLEHFNLTVERVLADDFDSREALEQCTQWFAGPSSYIYPLFALPLHRAVAAAKHSVLLSGFGGDQGVSGPVPMQFLLPTFIRQGEYRKAWRHLPTKNPARKLWQYAKYSHPVFHKLAGALKRSDSIRHPFYTRYFKSLREAEWSFLQGPLSHEVRMRIEHAAIASRNLGFEYRYPLLYPKLLEFFLSIPHSQKRREGGRFLIRRYLAQETTQEVFGGYKKRTGLGIFPCTFDRFKEQLRQGMLREEFENLPYPHLVKNDRPHKELTNRVKAYMLKGALS